MKWLLLAIGSLVFNACGAERAPKQDSETLSLSDAISIKQRSDGKYDVLCRDGKQEVVTSADLEANRVCIPAPTPQPQPNPQPSPDPFNPAFCLGAPMSEAYALGKIGLPNNSQIKIGELKLQVRSKLCLTADGCLGWDQSGPWGVSVSAYNWVFPFASDGRSSHSIKLDSGVRPSSSNVLIRLKGNRPEIMFDMGVASYSCHELEPESDRVVRTWQDFGKELTNSELMNVHQSGGFKPGKFSGVITDKCMAVRANNIFPVSLNNGNTGHIVQEIVYFSTFN